MFAVLLALAACTPKEAPLPPGGRPLNLWSVEREGHRSWLLGTCHFGITLDAALPPPADHSLRDARVVFAEADVASVQGMEALHLVWSDTSLADRLEPAAWQRLVWRAGAVPATMIDHLPPWVASQLPTIADAAKAPGGGKGMDLEVLERAKARGIPTRFVETLDQQVELLRGFDDAFLADLNRPSNPAAEQQATRALADVCYGGSEDLAALLPPDDPATGPLLTRRNAAWMPVIEPELAAGGAFVAVGAAHMLGDEGLVARLRARGFTVTRQLTRAPPAPRPPPSDSAPLEVPVKQQAEVLAWGAQVTPVVVDQVCTEGGLPLACLFPDRAACVSRLTRDAGLCVEQAEADPDEGAARATRFQGCLLAGAALDAIVHERIPDSPGCALITAAVQQMGG